MRHGQLAGIFLDGCEQLFHGVVGRILADNDDLGIADQGRNDGEVIIAQFAYAHGAIGAHGFCTYQNGIAVGIGVLDKLRADGAGCAALIDAGDGLAQFFLKQSCQRATVDVRGAARAVRDNHRDRTIRIIRLCKCAGQTHQTNQHQCNKLLHTRDLLSFIYELNAYHLDTALQIKTFVGGSAGFQNLHRQFPKRIHCFLLLSAL